MLVQYEYICIYIFMYIRNVKNKLRSWVDWWMERILHGKCIGEWAVQGDVARHTTISSTSTDPDGSGSSNRFSDFFFPFSSHFSSPLLLGILQVRNVWIRRKLFHKISYTISFSFFFSFFYLLLDFISPFRLRYRSIDAQKVSRGIFTNNDYVPNDTISEG